MDNGFIDYKENTIFCFKCNQCRDELLFFDDKKIRQYKTCKNCRDYDRERAKIRKDKKQKIIKENKECILEIV